MTAKGSLPVFFHSFDGKVVEFAPVDASFVCGIFRVSKSLSGVFKICFSLH